MKRIIIILVSVLSLCTNAFSQCNNEVITYNKCTDDAYVRINCVIFIDAKIPDYNPIKGYFEYTDSLYQKQKIEFTYITGDIVCKKEDFEKFNSNPPLNNALIMNLNYKDYTEGNNSKVDREYQIHLNYNLMFSNIVLAIANIDKKAGTYIYEMKMDPFVILSSNNPKALYNPKALKKSRQLKESYWIREAEYKRTHNIFQRMWGNIIRWIMFY